MYLQLRYTFSLDHQLAKDYWNHILGKPIAGSLISIAEIWVKEFYQKLLRQFTTH